MPAGSMPEWSYWLWGIIGILIIICKLPAFQVRDLNTGKHVYYIEDFFVMLIGIFLTYYWLNKIGIVPMYPWLIDQWFYGWR